MIQSQKGQAITEFSVVLMVFIPLIMLMVILANMLNVQTTAHKASRYMAWERMAYSEQGYDAKLSLQDGGFQSEISRRFLDNNGVGFGASSTGYSRDWSNLRADNNASIVELEIGIELADGANTSAQQLAQTYLSTHLGQLASAEDNGGMSVDTISPSSLNIPFSVVNNELLTSSGEGRPQASSSFALVADGWAPSSESEFTEHVSGMRSGTLNTAQRVFEGNPAVRWFGAAFREIPDRLFNTSDPFEMVSDSQSTALPTFSED